MEAKVGKPVGSRAYLDRVKYAGLGDPIDKEDYASNGKNY